MDDSGCQGNKCYGDSHNITTVIQWNSNCIKWTSTLYTIFIIINNYYEVVAYNIIIPIVEYHKEFMAIATWYRLYMYNRRFEASLFALQVCLVTAFCTLFGIVNPLM